MGGCLDEVVCWFFFLTEVLDTLGGPVGVLISADI